MERLNDGKEKNEKKRWKGKKYGKVKGWHKIYGKEKDGKIRSDRWSRKRLKEENRENESGADLPPNSFLVDKK